MTLPYQLEVMYSISRKNFLIHAPVSLTVVNLSAQSTSSLGSSSVDKTLIISKMCFLYESDQYFLLF